MKRTQIRKRTRRLLAVAGASMVLAVAPGTTAWAAFPDETTFTQTDQCQLAPRQDRMLDRICTQFQDEQGPALAADGLTSRSGEVSITSTSGSDLWPDAEYLWIAASIGAVAGAIVAFLHRRRPPLVS